MKYRDAVLTALLVTAALEYGQVTIADLHQIIGDWIERDHKVSVCQLLNFAEAVDNGELRIVDGKLDLAQ